MRSGLKAMLRDHSQILVCVLSIALGFSLAANFYGNKMISTANAAPTKVEALSDFRNVFESIADKMAPSVVNITSEKTVEASQAPNFDDFFNFGPFGMPRPNAPKGNDKKTEEATGTGVIVRSDGYILTNDHVVGGADHVTVKLSDGREFTGKVIRDSKTDLALVKIEAKDLPAAQFADSESVKIGEWALAMGNPFGFENTLTVGVVSGLRREFSVPDPDNPQGGTYYPDAIQTDASINPGNSGGPLVDIDGKIMGINSAIYSRSGGSMGIGFAIPANTAKMVMGQLIEHGKVVRGYLGLMPQNLNPVLSNKLGAKSGALVASVDKDSPAEKGGVEVKDVITKIDGKPIKDALDLRRVVQSIAPNKEVKIVLIRDKKEKTLTVKLGEAPTTEQSNGDTDTDKVGLSVQPLTSDMTKQLGVDDNLKGVVVRKVEPGSPAYRAGIRPNDVILEIDDTPVTSIASFDKAKKQIKVGDTAIVVVQRGDRSVILEMRVE